MEKKDKKNIIKKEIKSAIDSVNGYIECQSVEPLITLHNQLKELSNISNYKEKIEIKNTLLSKTSLSIISLINEQAKRIMNNECNITKFSSILLKEYKKTILIALKNLELIKGVKFLKYDLTYKYFLKCYNENLLRILEIVDSEISLRKEENINEKIIDTKQYKSFYTFLTKMIKNTNEEKISRQDDLAYVDMNNENIVKAFIIFRKNLSELNVSNPTEMQIKMCASNAIRNNPIAYDIGYNYDLCYEIRKKRYNK